MSECGVHKQTIELSGPNAARTAAVGLIVLAMAGVVIALVHAEPWPLLVASGLVVLPVAALGIIIVTLAGWFHATKSTWTLHADATGVMMTMQAANGRRFRHESVSAADVAELVWVEGDAEISAGVHLRTRQRRHPFVPAGSFNAPAFWDFALARFATVPASGHAGTRTAKDERTTGCAPPSA